MHGRREPSDRVNGKGGLHSDRLLSPLTEDEVAFDADLLERSQEADAVGDARCAGDGNDDLRRRVGGLIVYDALGGVYR